MPEIPQRKVDSSPSWLKGLRTSLVGVLLSSAPACQDEDPEGNTTIIPPNGTTTNNSDDPDSESSSEGEDSESETSTNESSGDTTGGTDGESSTTTSDTGQGTTETTSGSTDTGATSVDTESYDTPSAPTVDDMPQGNNVMPFFSEDIKITGNCEPVDNVQWNYVLEDNEAEFDWEDEANWENVTYAKGKAVWVLNTTLEVGVYKACFRTAKHGLTSPNDAVCFRIERIV